MNLNEAGTKKSIQPTTLIALLCVLVAILLPTTLWWFSRNQPPAPVENTAPPVTVEPAAAASPAAVTEPSAAASAPTALSEALEKDWGIQVSSIGLSHQGAAVDVQYKVTVPERAAKLAEGTTTIYLIDQASGRNIVLPSAPAVGAFPARSRARMIRQAGAFPPSPNRLVEGKINSVLFPNPDGLLKTGSKVAVVVGQLRANDFTVQ